MEKGQADRTNLLIDDSIPHGEIELTPEEEERIEKELDKYGIKDIRK